MLRHPGSLIPDSSCLLLNGMRWEGRTARLFLTRQNSSGLCLHLLSERIIPATAWRTQLFRISPSLDKPEANIKFLFAREEKHQDLPEHKPGKPRSPLKPSLKLSGWWHRSSQAAQRGGTDALQAIWCFYLSKPHDVCNPQNVFRQQIQGKEIELQKTLYWWISFFRNMQWMGLKMYVWRCILETLHFSREPSWLLQICEDFQLFSKLPAGFKYQFLST